MNANEHVNDLLRWNYAEDNKWDEILWLFPQYDAATAIIWPRRGRDGRLSRFHTSACQIHHIAGGMFGASRVDAITNIINLHPMTHEWCERYRNDGLALCYATKIVKREWDCATWREITGIVDMRAYLTTVKFEFPWVAASLENCERMAA